MFLLECKKCHKKSPALKQNLIDHYMGHTKYCLNQIALEFGIPNPYFETKEVLARELAEYSKVEINE